jgi:hypothetical protein
LGIDSCASCYIDIFYGVESSSYNGSACIVMDADILRYFSVKLVYFSTSHHQYIEELIYRVIDPAGLTSRWQTDVNVAATPTKFYIVVHMRSRYPGMLAIIRKIEVLPQTCNKPGWSDI